MNWQKIPPLTSLRAFSALAETGSALKAGESLNVSHAAISQQIKALEAFMGLALVDRSGRNLTLTTEGQDLARALYDGFDIIAREVERLTGAGAARPLQVSTTQLFATGWLMPRLGRFQQAHPEINLLINPTSEVVSLKSGGPDLALRFGDGNWPGLDAELLVPSDSTFVAAPSLVGEGEFTSPQELKSYPWLIELGYTVVPDWLLSHGMTWDGLRTLEMPGNLMLEAARLGQGIMVSAYANIAADVDAGRLRLLFRDCSEKGYHIVKRPGIMRPQTRQFIRWLKREAAAEQAEL